MATYDETSADLSCQTLAAIPQKLLQGRDNISTLRLSGINGYYLNDFLQLFRNVRKLVLHECECLRDTQDEVFKLTQLEEIDVSGNKSFEVICPAIGQLGRLKKLSLRNCRLKSLPDEFGQLYMLEELDVSRNHTLEVLCPTIGLLRRLKKLDLSWCRLRSLPDSFGNLESLEELDVSHNVNFQVLCPTILRLCTLKSLTLSQCGFTSLPDEFGHLELLEELNLSENRNLVVLSPAIGPLRRLKKLNLDSCGLRSLPDEIGHLESLEELHLSWNETFEVLCPRIGLLRRLQKLYLSMCRLTSLPDEIGHLESLEELTLSQIKTLELLCPTIGLLRRLKKLDLSWCRLRSLPDTFGNLESLEELNLSKNETFEVLCPSIGLLSRLKKLDLSLCRLTTLPDEFGHLEELEDLDLRNNLLKEFPVALLTLTKLRKLDLRNCSKDDHENRIVELPVALWNSPLTELFLKGNPLIMPPEEIWQQGMPAIRSYLYGMLIGSDSLCVDTINMLGDTCAGKTSIARSLEARCPTPADKDDRTRVMEQLEACVGIKTVNINDFGGHEIYHAVIPIFLPPGGLCILTYNLLESKEKQEHTVKKWLVTIFAKSSRVRVIVAGTRADQLTCDECSQREDKMRSFVEDFVNRCKSEITSNMIDLESRHLSIGSDKKCELERKFQTVSDADYCVRTLSCTDLNLSEKLRDLRDLVSEKVNPPSSLPDSWCRFIHDLRSADSDSSFSIYYTWEEVIKIRDKYLNDDLNDETLKIILRYLVKTSHIIWLEHNRNLAKIVYYTPKRIIELCKQVLHHERSDEMNKAIASEMRYEEYLHQYRRGIVSRTFIARVLQQSKAYHISDIVDTTIDFMLNFNLLSRLKSEDSDEHFFMPSYLLSSASSLPQSRQTPIYCDNLEPSIAVRIAFIGSLLPVSFFETSVTCVMSMVRYYMQAEVEIWREGITFRSNCVDMIVLNKEESMFLMARAPKNASLINLSNMCKVFHPVLKLIINDIHGTWNGAPPSFAVECPACRYFSNKAESVAQQARGKRKFAMKDLHSEPPADHWFCPVCRIDIPRSLAWPISSDMINKQDEESVTTFLNGLRLRNDNNQSSLSALRKKLKSARPSLVHRLDDATLNQILDHFVAARDGEGLITDQQLENVQGKQTRSDRVRTFLEVVDSQGSEAINLLAEVLQTACHMSDLAELLRVVTGP